MGGDEGRGERGRGFLSRAANSSKRGKEFAVKGGLGTGEQEGKRER